MLCIFQDDRIVLRLFIKRVYEMCSVVFISICNPCAKPNRVSVHRNQNLWQHIINNKLFFFRSIKGVSTLHVQLCNQFCVRKHHYVGYDVLRLYHLKFIYIKNNKKNKPHTICKLKWRGRIYALTIIKGWHTKNSVHCGHFYTI